MGERETVEQLRGERDEARASVVRLEQVVDRQGRLIDRQLTFGDAMTMFVTAIVAEARDAPNCWEVRGTATGRSFVLSVQWVDGKTPHDLLGEVTAERDAAVSSYQSTSNVLNAVRAALLTPDNADVVRHAREVRSVIDALPSALVGPR